MADRSTEGARPRGRFVALLAALATTAGLLTPAGADAAAATDAGARVPDEVVVVVVESGDGTLGIEHRPAHVATTATRADRIVAAGPEVLYRTQATPPNDPLRPSQWSHDLLEVDQVWTRTDGRRVDGLGSIVVAVVDSGVDTTHPDLAGRLLPGASFVGYTPVAGQPVQPPSTDVTDRVGHGTHVAGIIAAVAGNGIGVAGLAPSVRVLPVKVLDDGGIGTNSALAGGIIWATDQGVDIINLSLGSFTNDPVVRAAVQHAVANDVLVVAAVGNCGVPDTRNCPNLGQAVVYPAAWPETVGVGATTVSHPSPPWNESRAPFSSQGHHVDLGAPGLDIHSTVPGGGWSAESGTSMAAAVASGAAALVWARYPADSAIGLRARLARTAVDLGDVGRDTSFGDGRIDPLAAITPTASTLTGDPDTETDTELADADPAGADLATGLRDAACPATLPAGRFPDVDPASTHGPSIDCVAWWGITQGDATGTFGPARPVTRAQMATFLDRLITTGGGRVPSLRNPSADAFPDDAGSVHEGAVNRLAAAGIVAGRADGTFGPDAPITRGQLATFVARTIEYRTTGAVVTTETITFADVAGSTHAAAVATVAGAGIVAGRADGTYGADAWVTREQMATFLVRTTGHLVTQGHTAAP